MNALTAPIEQALVELAANVRDPHAAAGVQSVRDGLEGPLRVAIAGRVKAGKSTLVNALLRQRVAPTDVGECTRFVTWYRFGVPERLEVVRVDGTRASHPLQADGSLPTELGERAEDVARLDVWLSMDSLRDITIIDTPGLASATTAASTSTSELLQIDRSSRSAVSQAQVLLLVMPLEPRRDDLAVLEHFDEQFRGLARHAMNAVAVLSRIDEVGVSAEEVLTRARELAHRLAESHRLSLAAVSPVNGLVAETAGCALLGEEDAQALAVLASAPARERELMLLSADRFVSADSAVEPAVRMRLQELLDRYGIEQAMRLVAAGGVGAAELNRGLLASSGIAALRREVFGAFVRRAAVHKAAWAMAAVSQLSSSDPHDAALLRDAAERLELAPGLDAVRVLRAVQQVANGEVVLATVLSDDLAQLALAVGLDPTAPGAGEALDQGAVAAGIRRWREVLGDSGAGTRVHEVAETVVRSYENLL